MLIYRFKMITEDNDKFYREIEIKPGNTFEDFHKMILSCVNLKEGEMASFYICDSKWNKLQEIALADITDPDETEEESIKSTPVMSDVKLKECINDPHQRIIYVYDFLKLNTFYIELSKITQGEEKTSYPRCVKCVSEISKPLKNIPTTDDISESEDDLIEEDEFFNEDDLNFDEGNTIFGDSIEDKSFI